MADPSTEESTRAVRRGGRRRPGHVTRDLTKGSIPRNLWYLSWPQIAESFLSVVDQLADLVWAGRVGFQAIAGFGFDKMIRYGTHTKTLMTVHVAQMSAAAWDGLSAEHQQLIRDASDEALKMANDADRADAAKIMAQLSETIEFYEPTDEEFAQWREMALTVWDKFRDKIDADILNRVVEAQN